VKPSVFSRTHVLTLKPYFGKFTIVGIWGVIVNQGCLVLLASLAGLRVQWAGVIAIELSILNNFFLNNFWTWRDRRKHRFLRRFFRYHLVTLLSGICNYVVLVFLHYEGMHYVLANFAGIGVATGLNFFLNHYWTFEY
jgi:dolichol-phosphate mannosyltransferase